MKTYIYHYKKDGRTFSKTFKARDWNHAEEIARRKNMELKGEKTE